MTERPKTRFLRRPQTAQGRRQRELEARLAESEQRCQHLEARLAENEQRYRQLLDVAWDWFWETDAQGYLTYISPNIERVLNLPVSSYTGKRLADTEGVTYDRAAGRATLEAFKARQPYRDFVYSRKLANGKTVWISSSGAPRYGKDGNFLGYHGVARDVTSQIESERRLRQLEQQYRRLFESGSDSYWEMDLRGRVIYISSAFERSTGIPATELLERRLNDLPMVKIEPESGRRTVDAMQAGKPYSDLLHTIMLADSRVIHVGTSGVPVYDEHGALTGYCGISKDITVQVEAERALRRSEARFRELFEIASDYYWESDEHKRTTYVSENYEKVVGVPAAQALGKRLSDTPGISVDPEMGKMAVVAIKARRPYRDLVYSRKYPDGRTRWFKIGATPVFAADGSFRGYRGVGADITAHVEADQAARLAQGRLHDAVAYVTQPFVFYDTQDRAIAFNQAFTNLHHKPDVTMPVLQGVSFRTLAEYQLRVEFFAAGPHDEVVTLDALLDRYERGGEHTCHLRDGRWMLVAYRPLPGGGRVGLWTDITDIKRAEAERRLLELQLQHAQRLDALGTLAGGAAHEINNALVPVIALTKLVASHLPEESRDRRNLAMVLAGAERSRDLVKQILAFSRQGDDERRRDSLDLAAVVRDALGLMRATVPTSIRLVDQIAPAPPVLGDASQLHQVVVNLVTNAVHAIGEAHGTITVGLRVDADSAAVRVFVADTGCGMDEAMKARIFEPFFTTKEVGKGAGLGLAVAHGIIKDHGGRIEVESAPGKGARFDLVLPIPRAEAASGAAA
jgi:PAS domain S-box-containing protein